MKLNFTRYVSLPLSAGDSLDSLKRLVNEERASDFAVAWLLCKYHFQRNLLKADRFVIKPFFWGRAFGIEGFIERHNTHTRVYLRMMPPVWFYVLFAYVPLLLMLYIPGQFVDMLAFVAFWFAIGHIFMVTNVTGAARIFAKLDTVFESLGGTALLGEKPPTAFSLKTVLLYLLIAIIYISCLVFMGRFLS
jgi:hypothetical protein